MHACLLSHLSPVWLFPTPCILAHQPPLSTGLSEQESWSGLPCPPPGHWTLVSWSAGGVFTIEPLVKSLISLYPSVKWTISCKVVGKKRMKSFSIFMEPGNVFICQLNRIFLLFILHFLIETASYLKQITFTHVHANSFWVTKLFFRGMMMNRYCISW